MIYSGFMSVRHVFRLLTQSIVHPVILEFTEVYLDEPAFMAHASSREYLDGYGKNTSLFSYYT
jgi:hypothetical protein